MGARVLIVGTGAREHAIAWKLAQSPDVDKIFVAPGNGGTSQVATNIPVQPRDIDGLVQAAKRYRVDFYLATMDDPQPLGLVGRLSAEGILCYGPTAAAARLESSKAWAKQFMAENGIQTAEARIFEDANEATAYLGQRNEGPVVVKASGLAAGKGAIVCQNLSEAQSAVKAIMVERAFGEAGDAVVIEDFLTGWETSAHAFCDGETAVMMPPATDYKRARDGGGGLNTGGMGAYSPSVRVTPEIAQHIRTEVVEPTMRGMARIGAPYNGTLFPGLMVTDDGIRVLEFNARFGDPEAQVLVPRLTSDLFAVCRAAAGGRLAEDDVAWSDDAAVGVVIASGGYPEEYATGFPIRGLEDIDDDVLVFHAGTKREDGELVTDGGRVLTIVATGQTVTVARERAYANVARIHFEGAYHRSDIALEAVT